MSCIRAKRVHLVAIACVVALYVLYVVHRNLTQERILAKVRTAGGEYWFDYEYVETLALQRQLRIAVQHFFLRPDVINVTLHDVSTDQDMLKQLTRLRGLTVLEVGPEVAPVALSYLHDMEYLESLSLWGPAITDRELAFVSRLTRLEDLRLSETRVAGEGLKYLIGLPSLTALYLNSSPVEDNGMRHVGQMHGLNVLDLNGTKISDRGLGELTSLPKLKILYILDTNTTARGIRQFAATHPDCYVNTFIEWEDKQPDGDLRSKK